ncbi:hypothetical protein PSN_1830 [Pseudomonas sp. NGC7]
MLRAGKWQRGAVWGPASVAERRGRPMIECLYNYVNYSS